MNLSETNESLSQIKVPEKDKKALLKLIDIKIENDMEKFTSEIHSFKNELENFKISNSNELENFKISNSNELENFKISNSNELKNLKWIIFASATIITILLSIIALKK